MSSNEFAEKMADCEFRSIYFELLFIEAMAALELSCRDLGSVKLGVEDLREKISLYRQLARESADFSSVLLEESTSPPTDLFEFLLKRAEEYRNAANNVSKQDATRENQEDRPV